MSNKIARYIDMSKYNPAHRLAIAQHALAESAQRIGENAAQYWADKPFLVLRTGCTLTYTTTTTFFKDPDNENGYVEIFPTITVVETYVVTLPTPPPQSIVQDGYLYTIQGRAP